MTQSSVGSSIGTGTEADINENHPDGLPSRTFGTETLVTPASGNGPNVPLAPRDGRSEADAGKVNAPDPNREVPSLTEADVTQPDELLHDVPAAGVPVNSDDFPDGPNVAPSPWEEDAARGRA